MRCLQQIFLILVLPIKFLVICADSCSPSIFIVADSRFKVALRRRVRPTDAENLPRRFSFKEYPLIDRVAHLDRVKLARFDAASAKPTFIGIYHYGRLSLFRVLHYSLRTTVICAFVARGTLLRVYRDRLVRSDRVWYKISFTHSYFSSFSGSLHFS